MNRISLLILIVLLYSCKSTPPEQTTIQNFIDKNHIDAKVVEVSFVKNITAKDSVDYYHIEYLKLRNDNNYAPSVNNLEQAIDYCNLRIDNNLTNGYHYGTDLIFFEIIKKEKDKYLNLREKELAKQFKAILKIKGNPYPETTNFLLSNDLKKILKIIE